MYLVFELNYTWLKFLMIKNPHWPTYVGPKLIFEIFQNNRQQSIFPLK